MAQWCTGYHLQRVALGSPWQLTTVVLTVSVQVKSSSQLVLSHQSDEKNRIAMVAAKATCWLCCNSLHNFLCGTSAVTGLKWLEATESKAYRTGVATSCGSHWIIATAYQELLNAGQNEAATSIFSMKIFWKGLINIEKGKCLGSWWWKVWLCESQLMDFPHVEQLRPQTFAFRWPHPNILSLQRASRVVKMLAFSVAMLPDVGATRRYKSYFPLIDIQGLATGSMFGKTTPRRRTSSTSKSGASIQTEQLRQRMAGMAVQVTINLDNLAPFISNDFSLDVFPSPVPFHIENLFLMTIFTSAVPDIFDLHGWKSPTDL